MKGTVASNRMILFICAVLIAMLSVPFVEKAIIPSLQSSEEAQAIALSRFIASSVNSLSGVESGYAQLSLEKPMEVEVYLKKGIVCSLVPFTKDCGWYARVHYGKDKSVESRIIGKTKEFKRSSMNVVYIEKKPGSSEVDISGVFSGLCVKAGIEEINNYVNEASQRFGVDRNLILSVIKKESSFDSCAVSEKGAVGLMQIMPSTAEGIKVEGVDCRELTDARTNVLCGTNYLSGLMERYKGKENQLELALAAYNAGPGNVRKYGGVPPFEETRDYIAKVTRYMENCCSDKCDAEVFRSCKA